MERKRFSGVMLLFIVLAVVLITQVVGNLGRSGDVSYSDMRAYFTAEKVKSFTATDTRMVAKLQDGSSVSCALHSFDTFYNDMNDLVVSQAEKGVITSYDYAAGSENGWLRTLLPYVLAAMAFILLMNLIARMGGLGGGAVNDKMARFGEARIQDIPSDGKKVTFKDVAGADEEKEEQAQLRCDYIDSVKANLKSQLNTLYVLDEKTGKKTKIVDFERERAARAGKKKENR